MRMDQRKEEEKYGLQKGECAGNSGSAPSERTVTGH